MRQSVTPLQAESSVVLAARFSAGRFGTPPTKGLEGLWRCNGMYPAKGKKGCESKHIDDFVLY